MAHHLIYGGTFDPIHHGHLIVCRRCAGDSWGGDRVVPFPCGFLPHKSEERDGEGDGGAAGGDDTIGDWKEGDFLVDGRELARVGPSFTFDTISEMTAEQGRRGMSRMTLLIGRISWRRYMASGEELLGRVEMGVLPRPGVGWAAGMRAVRDGLGEAAVRRLVVLETPLIEISRRRRYGGVWGRGWG